MSRQLPLVLALDTATTCCAVALTQGLGEEGRVLASLSLNSRITHSRRLLTAVDWLMKESAVDWDDLTGVAVGLGPGSFTGLRIGLATAKGMAVAAGLPLSGVPTLDALAWNCFGERPVCAVLDARKKEVYCGWYLPDDTGRPRRQGELRALAPEALAAEIKEPALFVGDGLVTYGELWRGLLGERFSQAAPTLNDPPAAAIGLLTAEQLVAGPHLVPAAVAPCYVRASDAELSLGAKQS